MANELHKPIVRKFKERKVYSSFRDDIWGVDLAYMQSLSKYNKGNNYLLWEIDLFSKYVWVIPVKDKIETSIVNAFEKEEYQIKYGLIKVVNFTTIPLKVFRK